MPWTKHTISGQGGAVRYWTNAKTGARVVLCRNGTRLLQTAKRGSWRVTTWLIEDLVLDPAWRSDTTIAASAAVTRTGRLARRAG